MAKDVLSKLATKTSSSVLDQFDRKTSGKSIESAGKEFTLFISNEDIDDVIKIEKPLEKSGLLVDGATGTVKH